MFAKTGDSQIIKVMSVENGKQKDEVVVKCTNCGKDNAVCNCKSAKGELTDDGCTSED